MILGNQVEWAIHCCGILAALPPDAYLATKDLAELHGVPKEYLSKALQSLATAGLVEGTLGPRGGYRLAKAPERISFLDIVEAIEGRQCTFRCTEIRKNNPCLKKSDKVSGACAIAQVMARADEAWRNELRATTLRALADRLLKTVDPKILERTGEWVAERCGIRGA